MKLIQTIVLSALLFALSGCVLPTMNDLLRQVEQATPTQHSLKDIQFGKTTIGNEEDFKIKTGSPIFEFPTGKSYYKAIELPRSDKPYYLILRSYLISLGTDYFFQIQEENDWYALAEDLAQPYVFSPIVITLDERFNTVREITADAFQMVTDFHKVNLLIVMSPKGQTWLQTAIRFLPNSKERFVIIYTAPHIIQEATKFPTMSLFEKMYWEFWEDLNIYWPYGVLPKDKAYHSIIGRFKLSVVYPEPMFRDDEERISKFPKVEPGQMHDTEWFQMQAPRQAGFHWRYKDKWGRKEQNFMFTRFLPQVPGIVTLFINSEPISNDSSNLEIHIDSAIKEHYKLFDDLVYSISEITIARTPCRKIDIMGKARKNFLC